MMVSASAEPRAIGVPTSRSSACAPRSCRSRPAHASIVSIGPPQAAAATFGQGGRVRRAARYRRGDCTPGCASAPPLMARSDHALTRASRRVVLVEVISALTLVTSSRFVHVAAALPPLRRSRSARHCTPRRRGRPGGFALLSGRAAARGIALARARRAAARRSRPCPTACTSQPPLVLRRLLNDAAARSIASDDERILRARSCARRLVRRYALDGVDLPFDAARPR